METTYTPGPWKAEGVVVLCVDKGGKRPLATVECNSGDTGDRMETMREALANARLMAMAPDLLWYLEELADAAENILREGT